ncbi:MAG: prolyl oligopeptidase family serine peptidase [Phycisphaerae bacterium]|nr:prolyl oligopeptidase family serine peptidase [Phycisphaerae bacterium]
MNRNLSIHAYFRHLDESHQPEFRFAGRSREDWQRWRGQLQPRLVQTLGFMPQPVPLNPEILVEWREDGLIKQKIVFDVEEGLSATAYVFRPEKAAGRLPAILACHGHGPYGKEAVMGNRSSPELAANIAGHNYDYGLQMAKAGFVTAAIDWRGFGECADRRMPHCRTVGGGNDTGDLCNVHFTRAALMGRTLLGMDIHDGMRTLDYLGQQDFVDPERIGVMGLSFGGTMATWMSIMDPRIKAADIICYSDRFAYFAIRDVNFCGSQMTPGLYALCDVPDLHGLTAPRPLLVEIGIHDTCFPCEGALDCFHEVEQIYQAAGVRERLVLDLFPGEHRWGARESIPFFRKYL